MSIETIISNFQINKPQFNNLNDALVLLIHNFFCGVSDEIKFLGFENLTQNISIQTSTNGYHLPLGWNSQSDVYSFSYKIRDNQLLLKCLPLGDQLLCTVLEIKSQKVTTLELGVNEFIDNSKILDDYQNLYRNISQLNRNINTNLIQKIDSLKSVITNSNSTTKTNNSNISGSNLQIPTRGNFNPYVGYVGGNMGNMGNWGQTPFTPDFGGNLVGPRNMGFFGPGSNSFFPYGNDIDPDIAPGSVPFGARFDPINPFNPMNPMNPYSPSTKPTRIYPPGTNPNFHPDVGHFGGNMFM
eukprot:TRINITY_DN560_c1_g2_i1.p1 TRINITY_DN560_c1_g2~~TRINITY_DN560_c1_g2_i1.p1  ORF type:complete len:298 (+),score=119.45 TRINITY_DN560_c1_g2_i1:75-968(+)